MLGIIILNYNTSDDVISCVNSILKTTKTDYRIYIVDNLSTDDSYSHLRDHFMECDRIEVILSDCNGGYSYGNNIGIKKAVLDGCDYLLISNADIIYYKKSIDTMLEAIKKESDIGVIGPSCRSFDKKESQLYRKTYNTKLYLFSKQPFLYIGRRFSGTRTEYSKPKWINKDNSIFKFKGMVRGCCFLISSDLFKKMGYFDDNIFLYSEEWIVAKKLEKAGLFCACDFNAKVLHKEANSTSKEGTAFQTYHLYLSAFYYLKHYLKCNMAELLFFYLQNVGVFSVRAILKKDYRKLLTSFLKDNTKLLLKKEKYRIWEN